MSITTTTTENALGRRRSHLELQPVEHDAGQSRARRPSHLVQSGNALPKVGYKQPENTTDLPPPAIAAAVDDLEKWNRPRANTLRVFACFYAMIVFGLNDSAYGALLPYLESYYHLSYMVVSLVFLSPFLGYALASLLNDAVHWRFGQRGIAFLGPGCRLITYIIFSAHPPFPVLVIAFAITGFGNGLEDAAWCSWLGNMQAANRIQGLLHACYSLGATLGPLIATTMIVKGHLPWYTYYYMMAAGAAIELFASTTAFWAKDGLHYRTANPRQSDESGHSREAIKLRVTWLCAFFFFVYVAVEVSLGGWIVTYMLRIRLASNYVSGISATGFWAGMTVGRAGLGFVTEKFGERVCVTIYLVAAIAFQLVFWLVPHIVVSAVAVAFLGLFIGPMFPAGVVVSTKLLPQRLHVSAIGFATAIGGTGGAVFPFIIGAIAQAKGVQVLQPILLALLLMLLLLWLLFPRIRKRD